MRIFVLSVLGMLAAGCTTGNVSVPGDQILYEVPASAARPQAGVPQVGMPRSAVLQAGFASAQAAGPDDFTGRIERVLAEDASGGGAAVAVPAGAQGTPLDDDRLNLNEYTLDQQRIDAAIAERQLQAAREQLVIVQPDTSVPQAVQGANIALFAKQTTHAVGEKRYSRSLNPFASRGNCRRYATADEAQRAFLAAGGPERDPRNLDPDGDGFACAWDPTPYRRL